MWGVIRRRVGRRGCSGACSFTSGGGEERRPTDKRTSVELGESDGLTRFACVAGLDVGGVSDVSAARADRRRRRREANATLLRTGHRGRAERHVVRRASTVA